LNECNEAAPPSYALKTLPKTAPKVLIGPTIVRRTSRFSDETPTKEAPPEAQASPLTL
jgi:hypothetical protein